jgi:DNA-directed RNA polymerase specialized sigma24 family protein
LSKYYEATVPSRPETNFRSWIFQILRNTFLSSHSRLERRKTVPLDPDETSLELSRAMGTAESSVIERADADLVLQEINQLPLAFREVLLLCDVEEMSYKEIPEVLREGWPSPLRIALASRDSEVARETGIRVQG